MIRALSNHDATQNVLENSTDAAISYSEYNLKDDKNGSRYRYLMLASHHSPLKRVVIYHYNGNDVINHLFIIRYYGII